MANRTMDGKGTMVYKPIAAPKKNANKKTKKK